MLFSMGQRNHVVVTGGAGFIGSALVAHLAHGGERIVVIDNLVNGKRENLAGIASVQLRLVEADIRSPHLFASELAGAKAVFHLACLGVRHSLHAPEENHAVNATGTLMLLEAARQAGVPRFIHVSTSEVYGTARTVPMSEVHPTRPTTVYGAAKLAGEAYARTFHDAGGMSVTILRPFNAYGPCCHHEGDAGEVIPKFMLRALTGKPLIVFGDGLQTRDFNYVDDTAAMIALAARCEAAAGETINLGSGAARSILDVAQEVSRAVGRPVNIRHDAERPGDVRDLCAGTARAKALLGDLPTTPFAKGLSRLAAWYASRPVSPVSLLVEEIEHNWLPRRRVSHVV
ncbi:dTDP-glucose 4,6-dehydratase [Bradyrhizobium sp. 2TAF24]|uniref:dTDP-glucose 4,6-dehydratase n=1 Tax=Bradyrhizobium sp. 2TAF24 TaxID=3233011 RepID=UPI003F8E3692